MTHHGHETSDTKSIFNRVFTMIVPLLVGADAPPCTASHPRRARRVGLATLGPAMRGQQA
jgi:hypothetical protein